MDPNTQHFEGVLSVYVKFEACSVLTVEVCHLGQHHASRGHPEPVVQLEGAGRQLDGVAAVVLVVVVVRAVRVGVGQGGVLPRQGRGGVGVHGVSVERDP